VSWSGAIREYRQLNGARHRVCRATQVESRYKSYDRYWKDWTSDTNEEC
jgi:hypothetical protein